MHTNQRTWTDRRDGTRWTISGYWATHELLMGRIMFSAGDRSYETWYVSNQGVRHLHDRHLERLLDEARNGRSDREEATTDGAEVQARPA